MQKEKVNSIGQGLRQYRTRRIRVGQHGWVRIGQDRRGEDRTGVRSVQARTASNRARQDKVGYRVWQDKIVYNRVTQSSTKQKENKIEHLRTVKHCSKFQYLHKQSILKEVIEKIILNLYFSISNSICVPLHYSFSKAWSLF